MNLKTIFRKISFFSVLLCFGTCFFTYIGTKPNSVKADEYDFSYGNNTYTLNSKDIFRKLVGEPKALEEEFFNGLNYKVIYSENPQKENVTTSVIDDKLYVFAYSYQNIGNNSKTVNWVPENVNYKNNNYEFTLEDDHYIAKIDDYDQNVSELDVKYAFNFDLDIEIADEISNGAYYYAKALSEQNTVEEQQYAQAVENYEQYLSDLQAYNANSILWDNYEAELENYERYLSSYEEYQSKYQQHLQNKAEWEQYNIDSAKYQQYLIDLEYYNANHEQNLIDYEQFYPNYQKFEYRLNAMNLIYKNMAPMNRNIYDQVMGDSVTQTLNRKADLVALGVDENIINKAYGATIELRTIFEAYKSKQTDAEKYAYYRNNYSMIKANIEDLLRCLDKLYRSQFVPEAIASQGSDKVQKYLNLIAQLAYLANAIDDKEVYNYEGWNGVSGSLTRPGALIINDEWTLLNKTWREYLVGEDFLDVNSETLKAYPTEATFPTEVVELLVEPEEVIEPTMPSVVLTEPVVPTTVDSPVAPNEKLSAPVPIEEPIIEQYLTLNESELIYADAYESGDLVENRHYDEAPSIKLETTASIDINQKLKKVCRFLNYDGAYLYQDFFVDYPKYLGLQPFKPQDQTYNDYLFQNWNKLDGTSVELNQINASCELIANFLGRNLDHFDITFVIGNRSEVLSCPVGNLPTLPSDISLPETNEHFYEFVGWDKDLTEVSKAETYTAIFEEKNKYEIKWVVEGVTTTEIYRQEIMPTAPNNVSKNDFGNYYYKFIGWDKEIIAVNEPTTYTALFEEKEYILISWNIDGVFENEKYKEDEIVTYKGNTPFKEANDQFYYDFISWSKEPGFAAVEDTIIEAIFSKQRFINVTWDIQGQLTSHAYRQDVVIDNPVVEGYFDECFVYTFNKFELLPNSTNYDIFYRAIYDKDYIVHSGDFGLRVRIRDNLINIYTENQTLVDLSTLFELLNKGYEQLPIKIIGNSYSIGISKAQAKVISNNGCRCLSFVREDMGHGYYKYCVNLLDDLGNKISNTSAISMDLDVLDAFDAARSYLYLGDAKQTANINANSLSFSLKPNQIYEVYPVFKVLINENEGATITANQNTGRFGDKIIIEYTLKPGYVFDSLTIYETNGQVCNISKEYTLKGYDIAVGITVHKEIFKVNFYVDDEIFATMYVSFGEQIVPPENARKDATDLVRFVFEKWDKEPGTAHENEDFHAIFTEIEIPKYPENHKISVITVVEITGGSVAVIAIICAFLIIFRKKIFRKR